MQAVRSVFSHLESGRPGNCCISICGAPWEAIDLTSSNVRQPSSALLQTTPRCSWTW